MQNRLKRLGAAALTAALMMASVYIPVAHAETDTGGAISVNMADLGVPLLNEESYKDAVVKENYLYKTNGELNPGYKFDKVNYSGMHYPGKNLAEAYKTEHKKMKNGAFWNCTYEWVFDNDTVFRDIAYKKDLRMETRGMLKYDSHTNGRHWTNRNDFAMMTFQQMYQWDGWQGVKWYDWNKKQYVSKNSDGDEIYTEYGKNNWFFVGDYRSALYDTGMEENLLSQVFRLTLTHQDCTCGSSGIKNVTVGIADIVAPKIKSVTVDEENGKKYYGSGSFDIKIDFDEYIRFADGGTTGKTADASNRLVLKAYDRQTGMYLNDVTAELVSLDEKTLTYRYTVPDNNTTDIVITGIASADKQTMFNGDKPLYMYTSDGTYKHLIDSDGDMKINAPFCDLSGNSVEVDWQPLSFLGGNIYVDTVPPEYAATNISGSMMTEETVTCEPDEWPEDFDRSQVFAGAGDTLAFSVDFSEELKISDVSEIKATLNVKNADGENVVLSGTKSETVKTSVNTNIGVTRVTFDTLTVTEDMIPEDDGKAIRIKSVETADSADLCDNSFSAKVIGELAVPKQQEWLDTLAPSVKTDIVPNDGVYTPTSESSAYESGETVQGFCFPVVINERQYENGTVSSPSKYASGTNAVGDGDSAQESGFFKLCDAVTNTDAAMFEYCVTVLPTLSGNEEWKKGIGNTDIGFIQNDTGNYIHIRKSKESKTAFVKPVLCVTGCDYAGNRMTVSYNLDFLISEDDKPTAEASFSSENVSDGKAAVINAVVSDNSALSEVKYKVVLNTADENNDDNEPTDIVVGDDWENATFDSYASSVTINKEVSCKNSTNNFVYLLVYAKDICGNEMTKTFNFNCNLSLPGYTVGITTDGITTNPVSVSGLDKEAAAKLGWTLEHDDDTTTAYKSYGSLIAVVRAGDYVMARFIDELTDSAPQNFDTGNSEAVNKPVSKAAYSEEITDLLSQMAPADTFAVTSESEGAAFVGGMWYISNGIDTATGKVGIDANGRPAMFSAYSNFIKSEVEASANKIKNYYGEVEIYLLELDAKRYSFSNNMYTFGKTTEAVDNLITEKGGNARKPAGLRKYVLKSGRDDGNTDNPINKASFDSVYMPDGTALANDDPRLDSDSRFGSGVSPVEATKFATLSGMKIAFEAANNRVPEWGADDIDFENSYYTVYRDGVEFFTEKLESGKTEQAVFFPDDKTYENGNYSVKVTLIAKASGRNDTFKCPYTLGVWSGNDNITSFDKLTFKDYSVRPSIPDVWAVEDTLIDNSENHSAIETIVLPSAMVEEQRGENMIYEQNYFKLNLFTSNPRMEYYDGTEGRSYIKIWNAEAPNKVTYTAEEEIGFILHRTAEYIGGMNLSGYVPLIEKKANTICYQEFTANGKASSVKQLEISFSDYLPEVTVTQIPKSTLSQSVELYADAYSLNGNIKKILIAKGNCLTDENASGYEWTEVVIGTDGILRYADSGEKVIAENGTYSIYVLDEIGAFTKTTFEVGNSDKEAPKIEVSNSVVKDGDYSVTLNLSENMSTAEKTFLYIATEKTSEDPAGTEGESENIGMMFTDWKSALDNSLGSSKNNTGVYKMEATATSESNALTVTLEGTIPKSGHLYAYCEDEAGNRSESVLIIKGAAAGQPTVTKIERASGGGLNLTFSTAVKITSHTEDKPSYAKEKIVPIYNDGRYTISYEDIFGNEYSQMIEVALSGDFTINAEVIPLSATNGNVTLNVASARNDDLLTLNSVTVSDMNGNALSSESYEYTVSGDKQSASITLKENGIIKISMSYGGKTDTRTFAVNNIDRAVDAAVRWEYEAGEPKDGETETQGTVTAVCYPTSDDEELIGINGGLRYTFASGNIGDTYTFEVSDMAGNTAEITATLPVSIKQTAAVRLESYDMKVSFVSNSRPSEFDSYSGVYADSESYDFTEFNATPAVRDILSFNTNIGAKLLVLPKGISEGSITNETQSAEIDGITLSGKSITVTRNAEFTAALVENAEFAEDGSPRVILIPVSITNIQKIDNVELIYATLSRFKRRVYFDPKGQSLTLTNTDGIALENEHQQYNGYWYHDFDKNGEFVFYYKDSVGNTGSITAKVTDIMDMDVKPAEKSPIRWWPYKFNPDNPDDQSTLTNEPVNYNVTAQVRFNMNVTEAALYYAENGNANKPDTNNPVLADDAALNITMDLVDITFKKNIGETVLVIAGENNTDYTQPIPSVGIIDKDAPVVSHNYVGGAAAQIVTVTFTPDEDVLCAQKASKLYYNKTNPMKVTLTENGAYSYTFTDKAGNSSEVKIEVTNIDKTAPTVFYKLTENGAEYASWDDVLNGNNDVKALSEFYIKADEAASYSFQKIKGNMEAGTWTKIAVERNGSYPLFVTDKAGNQTFKALSGIEIPDTVPPVIRINPLTVNVNAGIGKDELDAVLKDGVYVNDNFTKSEDIKVTWVLADGADTNKAGDYRVIYTARDTAGNESKSERFIHVVGSDDIVLTVNGNNTSYMGTLILDTGDLTFAVGNLTNTNGIYEPYSMYVKRGFKTAGQMKNNSSKIQDNKVTLDGTGFYTVYIMTQSRKQYITYLYIEQ